MKSTMPRLHFILPASALALGCMAGCAPVPVQVAYAPSDYVLEGMSGPRSMQLNKLLVKIKRGEPVGLVHAGPDCKTPDDAAWGSTRLTVAAEELRAPFHDEMRRAALPFVADSETLFEPAVQGNADFLVGGQVAQVQSDVCYAAAAQAASVVTGRVSVKVEWQVYSRLERKIVFQTSTDGHYQASARGDSSNPLTAAFADAARGLTRAPGFRELTQPRVAAVSTAGAEMARVSIKRLAPFHDQLTKNINAVRTSVATVFAGNRHGSGFFVSVDGLLVTNEHVVVGHKRVRVKLTNGRELDAHVLRSDAKRDVALLRVEQSETPALPIRDDELPVGEDVFAVGTPLDTRLSATVTRGIVSGYRVDEGKRFIQSDALILPGSSGGPLVDGTGTVVGLTATGRLLHGNPTGLNFFIPIAEVFASLGLERRDN